MKRASAKGKQEGSTAAWSVPITHDELAQSPAEQGAREAADREMQAREAGNDRALRRLVSGRTRDERDALRSRSQCG